MAGDFAADSPAARVRARALWFEAAGRAALRTEDLPQRGADELLVETLWSGVSRGTERLVMEGRVPAGEWARMRAPFQAGDFPFPVKYGYCAVGRVLEGPAGWAGRSIFALHPHQDRFLLPVAAATALPENLPARRATLAANMETALNALWDSGAGPGDRIVVVGLGVVGLLTAALAARLPGAEVTAVDAAAQRAPIAQALGLTFRDAASFDAASCEADVVFHASASAGGLASAIAAAGMEARVTEMSWYGAGEIAAPLGGAFHARRLTLVSTQVGQVSPGRRPRWSYARRMAKALDLLRDDRLDALITHELDFADAPKRLPDLLGAGAPGLGLVLRYGDAGHSSDAAGTGTGP